MRQMMCDLAAQVFKINSESFNDHEFIPTHTCYVDLLVLVICFRI